MNSDTRYEYIQERIYRPDRDDFKSIVFKNRMILYLVYLAAGVAALLTIISSFYADFNTVYGSRLLTMIVIAAAIALYVSRDRKKQNENIVDNRPGNRYLINLGTEVKRFYGDAKKSSFGSNTVRPLLIDAEQVKRHGLITATTGAGKTVLMKGIIEQHALLGGGGLTIDGKGTTEFAKEIYGLFQSIGREKDFYHVNFLDMDNTHTVNPLLSGSAAALYEINISLLEGEENEWKAKQKEYIKNILKLLVYKRDNENLPLDYSELAEYLTLSRLVKEAKKYRHLAQKFSAIEDFIQFVTGSLQIDYREFVAAKDSDIGFWKKVEANQNNTDLQGVYDASMSAQAWRGIITNIKSDYGRVFNTQNPDISLYEAIMYNKHIFVTLPTMASDQTPKELGKLILGLIKGVAAEKAEKSFEPEIPFLVMPDEIGSYIVEGFGRLMSKSRALGIAIWPLYQSTAQLDDVGKLVDQESTERREIMDVVGTHIIMKNINPKVTRTYNEFLMQKKYIDRDYVERRRHIEGKIGAEQHFKVEKEDAVKHAEVVGMNRGEMMVIIDGLIYRAVAAAEKTIIERGKRTIWEGKNITKKIPIMEYLPKKIFMKYYNRYKDILDGSNKAA